MKYIKTLEGDYLSAQLIELEKNDSGYEDGWSFELRILSTKQDEDPIYWNRTNTLNEAKEELNKILNALKSNFDKNIEFLKEADIQLINNKNYFIYKGPSPNINFILRKLNKNYAGYIAELKDASHSKPSDGEYFEDLFIVVEAIIKNDFNSVLKSLISAYLNMKRDIDIILEYLED